MDKIRAKEIILSLADGIDPTTGEILPNESIFNTPEVIRALYTAAISLGEETHKDPLRNAGRPWSAEEDTLLESEYSAKMKVSEIANSHGRSYNAIISRLEHLGLKKKPHWFFKKK